MHLRPALPRFHRRTNLFLSSFLPLSLGLCLAAFPPPGVARQKTSESEIVDVPLSKMCASKGICRHERAKIQGDIRRKKSEDSGRYKAKKKLIASHNGEGFHPLSENISRTSARTKNLPLTKVCCAEFTHWARSGNLTKTSITAVCKIQAKVLMIGCPALPLLLAPPGDVEHTRMYLTRV